ncbi:hypothetical protein MCGE09_00356 [Thaumarchaeota archaeon SCGC AB-539-E09]|nr:hypothetical protein MCGE09_00356 [Thaumarchaeota archaeon SCGC AB-539-E09]
MPCVSLVKGDNRYQNVTKALEMIRKVVKPENLNNKSFIIKPNLVSDSNPLAVTHVDAVRAVVDFIRSYNPEEIIIAEATAEGNTEEAYRRFGYDRLEGVRLLDVNKDDYEMIVIRTLKGGKRNIRVSKTILNTDFKVSVARAKTHDHVSCTLTLKNMMGSVPHIDHVWMHGAEEEPTSPIDRAIESNYVLINNLVTVVKRVGVDLGIVDGLEGMEGNGPVNGTRVNFGLAAAGIDCVAVDSVMASAMGFDPRLKGDTFLADEEGLGISDLKSIEVIGEDLDKVRIKFKPHDNYYETQLQWTKHHPSARAYN